MTTPDQQVSEQIVAAIEKAGVLSSQSTRGLAEKLASGKMGPNDWKVLFRLDAKTKEPHGQTKN